MTYRPLVRELKAMVECLAEKETLDDAANAALILAHELLTEKVEAGKAALVVAREKAEAKESADRKFVVVGQVYYDKEGPVAPTDDRAIKVALGPYATELQAETAASSLFHSKSSGYQLRTWVLPLELGTPFAWHMEQKEARDAIVLDAKHALEEGHRTWSSEQPHWPGNETENAA